MSVSLEPTQFSWRVHVASVNSWQRPSVGAITKIQSSFRELGFTVIMLPTLYYNPTSRDRFIVKHSKASAMTLWHLKSQDSFSLRIQVEQEF